MLTAIILAAGQGRRMGTLKQLLPWKDGTILETVVRTVLACSELDDEVRVVLGAGRDRIRAALENIVDPRLRLVENTDHGRGMLSSIKCGVKDLPEASQGFMIVLGDQPLIQPELVSTLARHWLKNKADFLLPVHQGRRGHPVLVSAKYTRQVLELEDRDGGLRQLIARHGERVQTLTVGTPAIHIDLDNPREYLRYRPGGNDMKLIVIRGAGEMASGTAHRLHRAGYSIIMTELPRPLAVRRTVAFAQAVFDGAYNVEEIQGQSTESLAEAMEFCREGKVAIFVGDIRGEALKNLKPVALVDATLAKENLGTEIDEAPVVIGLGPGFTAGIDVHAVVETNRGHDMGRVLYWGSAQDNTGNPGDIGGYTLERVLKAPVDGVFSSPRQIGETIAAGEVFGHVGSCEIPAAVSGIVRGLLMPGTQVRAGTKLGDIDPRNIEAYCRTISEKARAIAGGVLEALLHLGGRDDEIS